MDDVAVLGDLVLTHDMIVEGVHFLSGDPPADVAWKLIAVNLSDLAAKGAEPVGCLLGCGLGGDAGWTEGFVAGLGEALSAFGLPLLGGDTVSVPPGAPRVLGLTALGRSAVAPSRSGARAGDSLLVTGTIGDAGLGLRIARGEIDGPEALLAAYRRPRPLLAEGQRLAPQVNAMMDVSDGLLLDAARMAEASGLALEIDLGAIPLSDAYRASAGDSRETRLVAATAGDDYQLLFATSERPEGAAATPVGRFEEGSGLRLIHDDESVPLPDRLGWLHETSTSKPDT